MNNHRNPKPHPGRKEGDPFVLPPGHHINLAGHHWLQMVDYDGHHNGFVVLQWQPIARKWCHSNNIATGRDYNNVDYYVYVAPCPMPMFDDEQARLRRLLDEAEDQGRRRKEGAKIDFSPDDWKFLSKILEGKLY